MSVLKRVSVNAALSFVGDDAGAGLEEEFENAGFREDMRE